jgi:hypothetical protein
MMGDTLTREEVDMLDNAGSARCPRCLTTLPALGAYLPSYATGENFKKYQSFIKGILDNTDYEKIGGKRFLKRSGWRKIAFAFQVSFEQRRCDILYDANEQVITSGIYDVNT